MNYLKFGAAQNFEEEEKFQIKEDRSFQNNIFRQDPLKEVRNQQYDPKFFGQIFSNKESNEQNQIKAPLDYKFQNFNVQNQQKMDVQIKHQSFGISKTSKRQQDSILSLICQKRRQDRNSEQILEKFSFYKQNKSVEKKEHFHQSKNSEIIDPFYHQWLKQNQQKLQKDFLNHKLNQFNVRRNKDVKHNNLQKSSKSESQFQSKSLNKNSFNSSKLFQQNGSFVQGSSIQDNSQKSASSINGENIEAQEMSNSQNSLNQAQILQNQSQKNPKILKSSLNKVQLNYKSHQNVPLEEADNDLAMQLLYGEFGKLEELVQFLLLKIDQKDLALVYLKQKTQLLETNLENNKLFLNMVVHDMRNPTNQIEFTIQQSLDQLNKLHEELEKLDKYLFDLEKMNNFDVPKGILKHQSLIDFQKKEFDEPYQIHENLLQEQESLFKQPGKSKSIINNQQMQNNSLNWDSNSLFIRKQFINKDSTYKMNNLFGQSQKDRAKSQSFYENLSISPIINKLGEKLNKMIFPEFYSKKDPFVELQQDKSIQIVRNTVQDLEHKLLDIDTQKNDFFQRIQISEEAKNQICSQDDNQNMNQIQEADQQINDENQLFDRVAKEKRITKRLAQNLHIQNLDSGRFQNKNILNQGNQQIQKDQIKVSLQSSLVKRQLYTLQQQSEEKLQSMVEEKQVAQMQTENDQNKLNQKAKSIKRKIFRIHNNLKESVRLIQNCKFNSKMLMNLINDMMDLAKTEKMQFELYNQFFDLQNSIERAFENLGYLANEKEISLSLKIDNQILPFVKNINGDEGRYTQIFLNFLSNAFKFTPKKGNIIVKIQPIQGQNFFQKIPNSSRQNLSQVIEQEAEECQIQMQKNEDPELNIVEMQDFYISFEIVVKDSGAGISRENLGKLFHNFSKLADSQGLNNRGTGLGLSICKNLIEKMGGNVRVESEGEGKGTSFIIQLTAQSQVSSNQLSLEIEESIRNHENKERLQEFIIKQRLSGNLDEVKESGNRFKKMLEEQKSNGSGNSLSQSISESSEVSQTDSQFEEHLIQLHQIRRQKNQQQQLPENIEELRNLKVLLINDDFFILQVLTLVMKNELIVDIELAYNGFEGFNKTMSKDYDLIICDLNMPVMDGFQFCKNFLKNLEDQNNFFDPKQDKFKPKYRPYLIALSAFVNQEIDQKALSSGFDLVIEQPLHSDRVKNEIIPTVLKIKKQFESQNVEIKEDQEEIQQNKQIFRGVSNQLESIIEQIKIERKISKPLNVVKGLNSSDPLRNQEFHGQFMQQNMIREQREDIIEQIKQEEEKEECSSQDFRKSNEEVQNQNEKDIKISFDAVSFQQQSISVSLGKQNIFM